MHEVLVNRLGGLSLPWKIVVRLTDRSDMTLDVYRGRKTTTQHNTTPANALETQDFLKLPLNMECGEYYVMSKILEIQDLAAG